MYGPFCLVEVLPSPKSQCQMAVQVDCGEPTAAGGPGSGVRGEGDGPETRGSNMMRCIGLVRNIDIVGSIDRNARWAPELSKNPRTSLRARSSSPSNSDAVIPSSQMPAVS